MVRFGPVRSDVIGHSVFDPEYYLCERELTNSKTLDFFYFEGKKFPNEQWKLMLRRTLRINNIFRYLDKTNLLMPGGKIHHKIMCTTGSRDIKGYLAETKPHITFTSEEDRQGRLFTDELGVKRSDRFVCLIVRDSAYKEKFQKWRNRDWSYHGYRDSNIDTYEDAALALAEKGYWVFRMGKMVHKSFKAAHPRILDYANSEYRSDFLDIWLMANCFLAISTSTGLDDVSVVFRRPILFVNHLPVGDSRTGSTKYMEAFKKMRWKETGQYLSLREQIDCGAIRFYSTNEYERLGIEIIDDTQDEIKSTVLEFEKQLDGQNNELTAKEEGLKKQFWNIMAEWKDYSKYHGKRRAIIGNSFLCKNHDWFLA